MGIKIRERPKNSGIWWVFIDHQGMRKAKKIGSDKSRALEVAKKIEAKLTLNDFGFLEEDTQKNLPTFREYAQVKQEH